MVPHEHIEYDARKLATDERSERARCDGERVEHIQPTASPPFIIHALVVERPSKLERNTVPYNM